VKRYKIDWGLALTIAAALAMAFLNVFEQLHFNEVQDGQEQIANPIDEETAKEIQRRIEDRRRSDSAPTPSAPDGLQRGEGGL
jgi:hypothetical protein